ncbi:hypothetical protein V2J09_008352 [Rumex salicifolius]
MLVPRIPVYTFGFGKDHDLSMLHAISELSRGTFSFIETEETIQDAFAQCIGGLLSVVVQELQVKVEHMPCNIKAGSYPTRIATERRLGYVDLGDLYAEGQRDFLVTSDNSTLLMQIKCSYKDPLTKETVTLEVEEVKIARPKTLGEEIVSLEVDMQRNRLQVAEAMSQARAGQSRGCNQFWHQQHQLRPKINVVLIWMMSLASMHVYETSGRAHILSGMSAHSWQRPTTRGDSTYRSRVDQSYETRSISEMHRLSRDTLE